MGLLDTDTEPRCFTDCFTLGLQKNYLNEDEANLLGTMIAN